MERFAESVSALAFAGRMLVRCPTCDQAAVAVRSEKLPQQPLVVRVTCTGCGFAKEWQTLGDGSLRDVPTPVPDRVCDRATSDGFDGRQHIDKYYGRIPAALPTWMKLARHRADVLAAIDQLETRLPNRA